jgi:DNA-binding IclR family transcriptional regulator
MTRDPLESLLRLRRLTVDQARRGLAECLRAESEATQSVASIEASIARETDVATNLASDDVQVEAYAAWLRRIRPKQQAAHAAQAQAEAATSGGRAVLAAAPVRAAEKMLEEHAAVRLDEAEHKAQLEIDEAAQRRGEP